MSFLFWIFPNEAMIMWILFFPCCWLGLMMDWLMLGFCKLCNYKGAIISEKNNITTYANIDDVWRPITTTSKMVTKTHWLSITTPNATEYTLNTTTIQSISSTTIKPITMPIITTTITTTITHKKILSFSTLAHCEYYMI